MLVTDATSVDKEPVSFLSVRAHQLPQMRFDFHVTTGINSESQPRSLTYIKRRLHYDADVSFAVSWCFPRQIL